MFTKWMVEYWFKEELTKGDFDAILVLAHIDVQDLMVYEILNATCAIVGPDIPVQFITGHSHHHSNQVLDYQVSSFEAGHFLDILGFSSFPSKKSIKEKTFLVGPCICTKLLCTVSFDTIKARY